MTLVSADRTAVPRQRVNMAKREDFIWKRGVHSRKGDVPPRSSVASKNFRLTTNPRQHLELTAKMGGVRQRP